MYGWDVPGRNIYQHRNIGQARCWWKCASNRGGCKVAVYNTLAKLCMLKPVGRDRAVRQPGKSFIRVLYASSAPPAPSPSRSSRNRTPSRSNIGTHPPPPVFVFGIQAVGTPVREFQHNGCCATYVPVDAPMTTSSYDPIRPAYPSDGRLSVVLLAATPLAALPCWHTSTRHLGLDHTSLTASLLSGWSTQDESSLTKACVCVQRLM